VREKADGITHLHCLRHLIENFNKQFKSKKLGDICWGLARATTAKEYEFHENMLKALNAGAVEWLNAVGKEHWSTLFSGIHRYGELTSYSVESVNSVLREIRRLPILGLFMALERYVGAKFLKNSRRCDKWGALTSHTAKAMSKTLSQMANCVIDAASDSAFIVRVQEPYMSVQENCLSSCCRTNASVHAVCQMIFKLPVRMC
jgi:hypothetical protein